jgi:predicted hydrocarbon binding protein
MSWLEDKMKKWAAQIDRRAPGQGDSVISGYDKIPDRLEDYAVWSEKSMERLSTAVPDRKAREEIMQARACVFTEEFGDGPIAAMAKLYAETKSVDNVLEAMGADKGKFGHPYREGNVIYEIRNPRDPEAFTKATTPYEKQMAACFCPLIRATRNVISKDYCHCSAGWYKGIYQGIFRTPARVEVLESIISGDQRCKFAIRLPEVLG